MKIVTCASPDYLKKRGVPKEPDALVNHDRESFDGLTAPTFGALDLAAQKRW
jgi:hypothetical protein